MKKILTTALAFGFLNATSQNDFIKFAKDKIEKQDQQQQTQQQVQQSITIDEYNYCSKGLLNDLNNGRDTKSNYIFKYPPQPEALSNGLLQTNNLRLVVCYRANENKPFAIVLKISADNKTKKTLCIPQANAPVNISNSCKQDFTLHFGNNEASLMLYATLQQMINLY